MNILCLILLISNIEFTFSTGISVWITLNPINRNIELNWLNKYGISPFDSVSLFQFEPPVFIQETPALSSVTVLTMNGIFKTPIHFPVQKLTKNDLKSKCLEYWIAYIRNDQVISLNCIKTEPTWMEDNISLLEDVALRDIMIPGTHNSGSYRKNLNQILSPIDSFMKEYIYCQDENIFSQLIYGIRYLDFRVSYINDDFYITHDVWNTHNKMEDVLIQIKEFLDGTKKEIVFIDLHRFPLGFGEDNDKINRTIGRHFQLLDMIEKYLGNYLTLPREDYFQISFNKLKLKGARVILSHSRKNLLKSFQVNKEIYLFPAFEHRSAGEDTVDELSHFFKDGGHICVTDVDKGEAIGAFLTPKMAWVEFYGGLRRMTSSVSYLITEWFREDYWDCANVVMTNFFLANNIIQVCIETMKRRDEEARRWVQIQKTIEWVR